MLKKYVRDIFQRIQKNRLFTKINRLSTNLKLGSSFFLFAQPRWEGAFLSDGYCMSATSSMSFSASKADYRFCCLIKRIPTLPCLS